MTALREMFMPTHRVFRTIYILLLMGLCVVLGQRAPAFSTPIWIISFLGIVFALLTLRRLQFGVFLLAIAALFVPFTVGTGTQTAIPASMVLAGLMVALWFLSMLMQGKVSFVSAPTNLPLLGFIVCALLSAPTGWLFYRPEVFSISSGAGTPFLIVQLAGLSLLVMLPLILFLSLNVLHDPKWVRLIFLAVTIAGLLEIIMRVRPIPGVERLFPVNAQGMFPLWIVSLLYGQLLFNRNLRNWQRVLFVVLIAAWVNVTLALGISWISGWAPIVTSLSVITLIRSRKGALLMLLLGAGFALLNFDYLYQRIYVHSVYEDFNRFTIWRTIIELVLNHASPLLGAGPAGYHLLYRTYIPGFTWSAHSNYVDIFAQTGILGFVFFTWFLIATLISGWRARAAIPDPFLQGISNGILGGFAGMIVAMSIGDWLIPFVYNIGFNGFNTDAYIWLLTGVMISLSMRYVTARASRSSPLALAPAPAE